MVMCFEFGCGHYSNHCETKCKFYRFPASALSREKWIAAIARRDKVPTKDNCICSCHFHNGNKNFIMHKDKKQEVVTKTSTSSTSILSTNVIIKVEPVAMEQALVANNVSLSCPSSILSTDVRIKAEPLEDDYEKEEVVNIAPSYSQTSRFRKILPLEPVEPPDSAAPRLGGLIIQLGKCEQSARELVLTQENEKLKCTLSEMNALKRKLTDTEELLARSKIFTFSDVSSNDTLVMFYTGMPTAELFDVLFSLFEKIEFTYYYGWQPVDMSRRDQLFLTLIKLKLNLLNADLSHRFQVSVTTISNIFKTWVVALHDILSDKFSEHKQMMPSIDATTNGNIIDVHIATTRQMLKSWVKLNALLE